MSPDNISYDEQLGTTFTQSFTSIAYNVTAVKQSDPVTNMGPAYLLNGLTDQDYWYQVGLSWNWSPGSIPGTGFDMVYEVWNSTGVSIFPTNGTGGLLSFSGPINAGDKVLLNLYFSATYGVVLLVKDYNTGAFANVTYSAEGGSYFTGLNSTTSDLNGYFTGLMTEWYHSSPYYSNVAPTTYSDPYLGLSSAWIWADEFGCLNSSCSNTTALFYNSTATPISYQNPTQLQEFSVNGATEFSNAYDFITGPAYVSLTASYSITGGGVGYSPPSFTYPYNGENRSVVLTQSPTAITIDADKNWTVTGLLSGSSLGERWAAESPLTGTATSNQTLDFAYQNQYRLFVIGGSGGVNEEGWYDSGSTAVANSEGVFDRNDGSGLRVVSYSIDGVESQVTPTLGLVSVSVAMVSSHQVAFVAVEQYQVKLNAGAMAGLKAITPPTVPGDNYWYDSGTPVTVTYQAAWNAEAQSRTGAVGYSVNGGSVSPLNVSAAGTFQVTLNMNSTKSIVVLSAIQYYTTFAFTNAMGSEAIVPTELQLTIDAKPLEVTGFGAWLNNGTAFTISNVVYESSNVAPMNFTQTVDGPHQLTVRASVYDGTIAVHDLFGLAVAGAQVKMTLANGTTISGATNADGLFTVSNIPLGTFTANVSGLGSTTSVTGDASQQAITSATLAFGTTSLGLVVALVAIAAVVVVVVLRRRKS